MERPRPPGYEMVLKCSHTSPARRREAISVTSAPRISSREGTREILGGPYYEREKLGFPMRSSASDKNPGLKRWLRRSPLKARKCEPAREL